MKFRAWIVLVAILFVALTAWLYFNPYFADPIASTPSPASKKLDNQIQIPSDPLLKTDTKAIAVTNFSVCKTLLQNIDKHSGEWAREHYLSWDKYLNDYSLDEVTMVIDKLLNSNFAVTFRVKQLRKDSTLAQFNQKATKDAKQELIKQGHELSGIFAGIKVLKKVPAPEFENLSSLSATEQQSLFITSPPSIDDAAALMLDEHVSNQTIIALLSSINNLNASVGFDKLDTISVLDYAIAASRAEVVSYLFKRGVEPSKDAYMGSSMEWALSRLMIGDANKADAAAIVQQLQGKQANARFNQQDSNLVEGFFPRQYYRFEPAEIASIQQQYGLDLLLTSARDELSISNEHPLLLELLAQQQAYTEKTLKVSDLAKVLPLCRNTIDKVSAKWQPKDAYLLIEQADKTYTEDPDKTIEQLAKVDPSLVDCMLVRFGDYQRRQQPIANLDPIFRLLSDDKVIDFIDSILAQPLNDAQKNWVFSQAIMYNSRLYDDLFNSDLFVEPIQYFDFNDHMFSADFLTGLEESSYDLHGHDYRGKTLLFYAVVKGNVDIIKRLVDDKFPFIIKDIDPQLSKGLDPLHVALSIEPWQFKPEDAAEKVDLLMRYQPKIDEFHLRRMGLIKLKFPDVYQQIISTHTQLKVVDDNALPLSICGI
jgi:ankyrin repeat protein